MKEAAVLTIGVVNIQTGKTQYDWSIYDHPNAYVFLTGSSFLMYGTKDSLEIGDEVTLRNNDSNRKINTTKIIASFPCVKETLIKELLNHGYDYRQLRAFAKKRFTHKLRTSYSIKGVK